MLETLEDTFCTECGELHPLNSYGLCDNCEEELQQEKRAIEDTEYSLNQQF
jgi:hypothetical protein